MSKTTQWKQRREQEQQKAKEADAEHKFALAHAAHVSVVETPGGDPTYYMFERSNIHPEEPENFMIVGFDTEFVAPSQSVSGEVIKGGAAKYEVLSYQFHAKTVDGLEWSGIALPEEGERMSFTDFITFVIAKGIADLKIDSLPDRLYLVAHYNRADIPAFDDRDALIKKLNNIRSSLITRNQPIELKFSFPFEDDEDSADSADIAGSDKPDCIVKIHVRDTFLLAPTGSKSLAEIGNLIGREKMLLSDDPTKEKFYKNNMDVLLKEDWPLFKRYALNDAEVCVRYFDYLAEKYLELVGKRRLPSSLSGIGVKMLIEDWKAQEPPINQIYAVGKEPFAEIVWDGDRQSFRTDKSYIYIEELHWFLDFATECYHGGRNEQFWFGPSFEDDWSDYDLTSAYPTAMAMIGMPSWRDIYPSRNLDDFAVDKLGFCCVDFEFPEGTRYPTLPVRTKNGIIFPLSGRSYCCTPEVAVALALDCKLTLRHGVIIPHDPSQKVFESFLVKTIAKRAEAPTKLEQQFWKELTNSCYGKTGQGLRRKRMFNVSDKKTKPLPESPITNPYYAAFITSSVRAVLGEMLNALPQDKLVFSVTTDGFITNATEDDIAAAQTGPMCQRFAESRLALSGKSSILSKKHAVRQVLGWKTRGQATIIPGNEPDVNPVVLAKGGIQAPPMLNLTEEQNDYIVNLFFDRHGEQTYIVDTNTTIRDMVLYHADLVKKILERRLNMEYDFKRMPSSAVDADVCFQGRQFKHLAFNTKPWPSDHEFKTIRSLVDDYIKEPDRRCVKTRRDYEALAELFDVRRSLPVSHQKYLRKAGGADLERLRRDLCLAFKHGMAGLDEYSDMTANEFCDVLRRSGFDRHGVPCARHHVQNAKRKEFEPHTTPRTARVLEVIQAVRESLPKLDMDEILSEFNNELPLRTAIDEPCIFVSRLTTV